MRDRRRPAGTHRRWTSWTLPARETGARETARNTRGARARARTGRRRARGGAARHRARSAGNREAAAARTQPRMAVSGAVRIRATEGLRGPSSRGVRPLRSAALQDEPECASVFAVLEELVARLARKGFEIANASRVRRGDADRLSRRHVVQRLLRAQDGQRTVESTRVDFTIDSQHGNDFAASRPSIS